MTIVMVACLWFGYCDVPPEPPQSHEVASYAPETTTPPTTAANPPVGPGVEKWRGIVVEYFPPAQVERALCIMWHESRGIPTAVNTSSGASGLFQFIPSTWANMIPASLKTGSVFDPRTNIAAAAWLQAAEGWTQWSPYKRGLCH